MPRPFAVIGITVFLVLMVLSGVSSGLVLTAFAVFTAALLISLFNKNLRRQRVFPVAFASAAVAALLLLSVNEFYYYPLLKMAGKTYKAEILITDECEKKYGNFYYNGSVAAVDGEKVNFKVYLCFSSSPGLKPYDKVNGSFKFYKLGQTNENIAGSGKAENRFLGAYPADAGFKVTADKSFHPGRYAAEGRIAIRRIIMRLLPNDSGGLCAAMLTGDRSALSDSALNALKKCGVSHIICVSGLHLSLWTSALLWVLRKLRIGEKAACAVAVPSVLFLMIFMGMTYSVIRSGIMMLIYLISVLISQRKDSLNSLGLALVVISVFNPFAPGHLSLQLSALSTMGIITAGEHMLAQTDGFFKSHKKLGFLKGAVDSLIVTFSAVIFTLPVTFPLTRGFNFGVFPSNLLIVITAEICMLCAVLGFLIGAVTTSVINLPAFCAGLCAKSVLSISRAVSRIGFLQFNIRERDAYIILCGLFVFCSLAVLISVNREKLLLPSACFLAGIFAFSLTFYSIADSHITRITAIDSGNGSSVLISKGGENILIGCGGDSFGGAGRIKNSVDEAGGNISYLIIPGEERRHSSFLVSVTEAFKPEKVYFGGADYTAKLALKDSDMRPIEGEIKTESGAVCPYKDSSGKIFFIYRNKEVSAAIIPDPLTDLKGFENVIENCDFMISSMDYPEGAKFRSLKAAVIQADSPRGESVRDELLSQGIKAYDTATHGNLTIEVHGGKAEIKRG